MIKLFFLITMIRKSFAYSRKNMHAILEAVSIKHAELKSPKPKNKASMQ